MLVVACWAVIGVLAIAILLRLVVRDRNRWVFELVAFTFWLYLPAYALLLVAAAARRPGLAVGAVVVIAFHGAWAVPSFAGKVEIPPTAGAAPRFVLLAANVRWNNREPMTLVRELMASDADVLDLQEVTPAWIEEFRSGGLLDAYPHHALAAWGGSRGTAILSRLPLQDATTLDARGNGLASATIVLGARRVRLLAVHPVAPTMFLEYQRQRDFITDFATRATADPEPLILAGDFNTTQYHAWFGHLKRLGLRSAHTSLGRGLANTWPNGDRRFPPIRLDHVLVTHTVIPMSIREGKGSGSDHKPVIVELALT